MGKLIWSENGKTYVRIFSRIVHQDVHGRVSAMDEDACNGMVLILNTGASHEEATPIQWIESHKVVNPAVGFSRFVDWVLGGVAATFILNVATFVF